MRADLGLAAIVALLTCAVYGGALVVSSLQSGLNSLEARMGADIIVAPATARSQYDLNEVLLEGVPRSFYMDKGYVAEIAAREGVEIAAPQYFLATMKAGCCAMPVQIIGFDPQTDFTVKPWIARTYGGDLGMLDIIAGCNISGGVGGQIQFYGENCRIVGKLAETGTSMDNAVYATDETVTHLVAAAVDLGFSPLAHEDPTQVVSTVMVKVADGYDVDEVMGDIKLHVRGVTAVATRTMTSDVADSVAGMSGVIQVVFGVIGVLALVVLVVAFIVVGQAPHARVCRVARGGCLEARALWRRRERGCPHERRWRRRGHCDCACGGSRLQRCARERAWPAIPSARCAYDGVVGRADFRGRDGGRMRRVVCQPPVCPRWIRGRLCGRNSVSAGDAMSGWLARGVRCFGWRGQGCRPTVPGHAHWAFRVAAELRVAPLPRQAALAH